MSSTDNQKKLGQIIAQCWRDTAFKNRFVANPRQVLQEKGIVVPDQVEIKVVENTQRQYFITIPEPVTELSDEQLDSVVAGAASPTDTKLESVAVGAVAPSQTYRFW
jgi:hypothetical protein